MKLPQKSTLLSFLNFSKDEQADRSSDVSSCVQEELPMQSDPFIFDQLVSLTGLSESHLIGEIQPFSASVPVKELSFEQLREAMQAYLLWMDSEVRKNLTEER